MITNERRDWLVARLDEARRNPDHGLVEVSECLSGMEADSEVSDLMSFIQAAIRATRDRDVGSRLRAIQLMCDRLAENDLRVRRHPD